MDGRSDTRACEACIDSIEGRLVGLRPHPQFSGSFSRFIPLLSPYQLDSYDVHPVPALKKSMSSHLRSEIPRLLHGHSDAVSQVLKDRCQSALHPSQVSHAVLDSGLLSRVEFTLRPGLRGNRDMAYHGDTVLSAAISSLALACGRTPHDYQRIRAAISSRVGLAEFFDRYFFSTGGPVTWEVLMNKDFTHSKSVKAEFIEALIGVAHWYGDTNLFNRLFQLIVEDRYAREPDLPPVLLIGGTFLLPLTLQLILSDGTDVAAHSRNVVQESDSSASE